MTDLLACRVTLADGTTAAGAFPPAAHTRAFLKAIVAHQEVAAWVEIPRSPRIDGELRVARWPRDNFHDPADHAAILAHIDRHASRGQELSCGIVPKTDPQPRKEAAQAGRVVWVDIDRKSPGPPPTLEEIERLLNPGIGEVASDALVAAARLLALPARPHLVTPSGSGGAHGYWRIEQTLAAEWIERANVRLIHHLGDGADYASFDQPKTSGLTGAHRRESALRARRGKSSSPCDRDPGVRPSRVATHVRRSAHPVPATKHARATCGNDGCAKAAVAFGLCPRRYRWKRDGRTVCGILGCGKVARTGERLCRGHVAQSLRCTVENRDRPVKSHGLCERHYKLERKPTCSRSGCERRAARRGLCQTCYDDERLRGRECTVAGCKRQQRARGWCALHYNRWLVEGDPGEPQPRREYGAGRVDVHGYRWISVNGVVRREHHVVMEAAIGRSLRPYETVHHRNSVHADNRPANLELWATAHPAGARVEDLVDWVVTEYADRVRQRLASGRSR